MKLIKIRHCFIDWESNLLRLWSIFFVFAVSFQTPAIAATFIVSKTNDSTNSTSLRGAIIAANHAGGANLIVLTSGIYRLSIAGADEVGGRTGDLDITNGSVTIIGSFKSPVVIDATDLGDRVFRILPNAQLTLSDLVITGGSALGGVYPSMSDGESGGAIFNMGVLDMVNCVVTNNFSGSGNFPMGNAGGTGGGAGGGIYNLGILTMAGCVIAGNQCGGGVDGAYGGDGGGLYNTGTCLLTDCQIAHNASGFGGGPAGNAFGFAGSGGSGGGAVNTGIMTLVGCAIFDNSTGSGATGGESGIIFGSSLGGWGGSGGNGAGLCNGGDLFLRSCSVSSNVCGNGGGGGEGIGPYGVGGHSGAGGSGAGIYNGKNLTLDTCTLGYNQCGNGGEGGMGFSGGGSSGGPGGDGGGIYSSGYLDLVASTVALNSTGLGGSGGVGVDYLGSLPAAPGGGGGNGGGLWIDVSGTAIIWNSLVASNSINRGGAGASNFSGSIGASGADGIGRDCKGTFRSLGFNLIGQAGGFTGFANTNGDLVGSDNNPIDPRWSAIQTNGNSPLLFALLPGSPAIDAGDDAVLGPPENLTLDQRGNSRRSGAHVDIGAFEYNGMFNGKIMPPLLTNNFLSSWGVEFWFNGAPGLEYSVWVSSDLSAWIYAGTAVEDSTGWFLFQDADPPNQNHRYYQVRYP